MPNFPAWWRKIANFLNFLNVKDLYFAKESLQLSLSQTRLELAKAREIATKIREFCRWKNVNCPYEKNPAIADYLLKSTVLEDDGN